MIATSPDDKGLRVLFFKAGTARDTLSLVNRLIVHANDGLGTVAPEVTRCEMFTFLLRKGFLRCGAHVQAFGP
jgi:hypothetical protein